MSRATGTFDVDLAPQSAHAAPAVDRMSIDKRFAGDLVGTSKGEMLAHRTGVQGSAGYVAVEHVEATLAGRSGSFVLQHFATMDRGEPQQVVEVIPDSGTDGLEGITGRMNIIVDETGHAYEFEYELPGSD